MRTFRARLTAWYGGFFAALLVLFCLLTYQLLSRSLVARLDAQLAAQSATAAALLEDELHERNGDLPASAAEVASALRVDGGSIVILHDGAVVTGRIPPGARLSRRRFSRTIEIVAAASLDSVDAPLRLARNVMFAALPAFLLLAGIGGYLLARRNLAPLEAMAAQARRIGAADLEKRLDPGDAAEEVATLAAAFNELLGRVDRSVETMRRFVADASHELRTPLAVIRGEADVSLAQQHSPAEYRESLSVILDESRRLSRLVDDLLNLARADAGRVRLQVRDFYFNDLLGECCRAAQSLAAAHGVALLCRADADVPFSGDEELLRRLVMNLLDNAIRYTPAGGSVTASVEAAPGGVRLRVSDTGIGIAPDAAPHVFERFFRGDRARTRAEGGFGLGLSIVKWIAESHHGAVELDSRPAEGSTFTVTLPQTGDPS